MRTGGGSSGSACGRSRVTRIIETAQASTSTTPSIRPSQPSATNSAVSPSPPIVRTVTSPTWRRETAIIAITSGKRPRTNVYCVKVEPTESPTFTSPSPWTWEAIEFAISGRSVPSATSTTPTTNGGAPSIAARARVYETAMSLATKAIARPPTRSAMRSTTCTRPAQPVRDRLCVRRRKDAVGRRREGECNPPLATPLFVDVEAAAALAAEEPRVLHRDDPRRWCHARLSQLLVQRLGSVNVHVDPDQIDEGAGPHRPSGARSHRRVQFLG